MLRSPAVHAVQCGTASQPHENFVRWQCERAVEKERLRELAEGRRQAQRVELRTFDRAMTR